MSTPVESTRSHKRAWIASVVAVVTGLVLSGALVWNASYSAFSATTSNATNSWAAGSVVLTDDDGGSTVMFNVTNMKPGQTATKCITVTSTGTLASAVKLYGTSPATTNALSTYINLQIRYGTGGNFASCTGFTPDGTNPVVYATNTLLNFGATYTNYTNGAGNTFWNPTGSGSESRTYEFTYTFSGSAPNSTQSGTASIGFTWEAQNT